MKTLTVEHITRIEGHLNFTVIVDKEANVKARAEALEGVRLLERLLIGKSYREVPDIVSRMCGVCQAIHRITSIQALEDAFGITLPEELEKLRKIIAIGGHLQSHVLHLFIFVLPDFTGHKNILGMLPKHGELISRAFRLKKLANDITEAIGGRAIHPITPVVGGFSKIPSRRTLEIALDKAREFRKIAEEVIPVVLSLEMPDFKRKTHYVSLYNGKEFPLLRGSVKISQGNIFKPSEYEDYIEYITEEYSTARHYVLKKEGLEYMVGALSRININYDFLTDTAKSMAKTYGLKYPAYSPFENNKAQALEIIHFAEEVVDLIEDLLHRPAKTEKVEFSVKEGEGVSVTEAPRGLLIHHYKVNEQGRIEKANIITPTAQNYKNIEADLVAYTTKLLLSNVENIEFELKKLVRAYDPCISCSARFFKEH